ncbi:MAG: hypothetical protein RLZZ379_1326, partial [Pseudomonadota bacterium]
TLLIELRTKFIGVLEDEPAGVIDEDALNEDSMNEDFAASETAVDLVAVDEVAVEANVETNA